MEPCGYPFIPFDGEILDSVCYFKAEYHSVSHGMSISVGKWCVGVIAFLGILASSAKYLAQSHREKFLGETISEESRLPERWED